MKKVIYMNLYRTDATHYYRLAVLEAIRNPELSIREIPYSGDITWASFSSVDVLVLERPSSENDLQIIKLAKQCGVRVVVDHDDDCLHVPVLNPMWSFYQERKAVVMECLALSDEVWVSTKSLKNAFNLLNSNIHVIPNALNDYLFPVDKKQPFNTKTKKAFWRGGGSHEADVYAVAPELIKLINRNIKWQFQFIGCRFIYLELNCGANYTPVSLMPLMQYMEYMNQENPTLVFHPLQDNLFNKSKSNISWIEATYAGAAFFGNKNLPEFDNEFIWPIEYLDKGLSEKNLEGSNMGSWQYIKENLLLSKVNLYRQERLLSI